MVRCLGLHVGTTAHFSSLLELVSRNELSPMPQSIRCLGSGPCMMGYKITKVGLYRTELLKTSLRLASRSSGLNKTRACASERGRLQQISTGSWYAAPALSMQQTSRTPMMSIDGTDRLTDGRTDIRPLHKPRTLLRTLCGHCNRYVVVFLKHGVDG